MEHLLKECTTEDLMEYNEAAKECVLVDEQCVLTRQEEQMDTLAVMSKGRNGTNSMEMQKTRRICSDGLS